MRLFFLSGIGLPVNSKGYNGSQKALQDNLTPNDSTAEHGRHAGSSKTTDSDSLLFTSIDTNVDMFKYV